VLPFCVCNPLIIILESASVVKVMSLVPDGVKTEDPLALNSCPLMIITPLLKVLMPITSRVEERVVAPLTSKIPAIEVSPLEAMTLNLSVLILKFPVRSRIPPSPVLPVTSRVEERVVAPVTFRIPPTVALLVIEVLSKVARSEVTRVDRSVCPVTPRVPPSVVAPLVTAKVLLPVTVVLPLREAAPVPVLKVPDPV
jgi:hypothetical protein